MEDANIGFLLEEILSELRELNGKLDAQDEVLLSPASAAAFLGKSTHTLRNYVERGYIKPTAQQGRKGYRLSDLKKLKRE